MKEIKSKIADLRAKETAKKKRFDELTAKSEALKNQLKTLSKELSDIAGEIRKLEMQSLIKTLENKGIGVSEVEKAVEAGIFGTEDIAALAETVTETRSEDEIDHDNTDEQEENSDEIGSSRKALGNA